MPQFLWTSFAEVFKSCKLYGLFHHLMPSGLVLDIETTEIINIFIDGQLIKNCYILQNDADLLLGFIIVRTHFLIKDTDAALVVF